MLRQKAPPFYNTGCVVLGPGEVLRDLQPQILETGYVSTTTALVMRVRDFDLCSGNPPSYLYTHLLSSHTLITYIVKDPRHILEELCGLNVKENNLRVSVKSPGPSCKVSPNRNCMLPRSSPVN